VTRLGALDYSCVSLEDARADGFVIVDVRDARERGVAPLSVTALHLPAAQLLGEAANLELDGRYLLVCGTGKRSAAAADLLHSQGFRECRSLRGGLRSLQSSA
jgi:rhodanese-related sulfurtransferase